MGYITELQFEDQLDVPIQLPITDLEAGTWLIVASIGISSANPLSVLSRWLQLRMVSGSGTVTLGLYLNFNTQEAPSGQTPLDLITLVSDGSGDCSNTVNSTQFQERDPTNPITLTLASPGPGVYSWVVYASGECTVLVNGAARLNFNPTS